MGNMTKVRDERGHDKNYTYDDRNRVTATDDPDREGMKNTYDDLNRLTETQPHKYFADNRWIHFAYDSLSRNTMIWSDTIVVSDTTWEMFDDFEDGINGWDVEQKTKIEWESGGYNDAHSMKIGQITQGSTNITAASKDFSLSGGNEPYCSVRLRVKAYITQNDHYVKIELRGSGGVVKWNEVNVSSSTQWLTLQLSCDDVNPEDVTFIRIINYLKTGEDVSSVKVDNIEKGYVWKMEDRVFAKKLYDEKLSPTSPYAPPSGFYGSTPNLKGRLSAVFYSNSGDSTNFDAVECYEYDNRARLSHKGVRLIVDGAPKWYEIRYEYDSANNLTAITYPDGSEVSYDYNSQNRLSEVSDGADISYNTFTYDASGLDTLENYGNTGSALFEYNASGILKSMNIKMPSPFGTSYSVFKRSYVYDKSGNLTYEKKDLTTHANYEYDALYRLTKEQYPQDNNWLMTYTYDRAGNRKSANLTQYTIDGNNNRLVSQGGNYYYYNEDYGDPQKLDRNLPKIKVEI